MKEIFQYISIIIIRHLLSLAKSKYNWHIKVVTAKNRFYSPKVYFSECLDVEFYIKPA